MQPGTASRQRSGRDGNAYVVCLGECCVETVVGRFGAGGRFDWLLLLAVLLSDRCGQEPDHGTALDMFVHVCVSVCAYVEVLSCYSLLFVVPEPAALNVGGAYFAGGSGCVAADLQKHAPCLRHHLSEGRAARLLRRVYTVPRARFPCQRRCLHEYVDGLLAFGGCCLLCCVIAQLTAGLSDWLFIVLPSLVYELVMHLLPQ